MSGGAPTLAPTRARSRARTLGRLLAVGAVAAAGALAPACGGGEVGRPDILIVTFDTTRADRIGAYGAEDARTPVFDRLARAGRLFTRARAPTPITLPSHTTLLTGTTPPVHGVRENAVYRVPDEARLLSEVLSEEGWSTGAFVGSFVLDERFGLDQGFDVYKAPKGEALAGGDDARRERPAGEVVDDALRWLSVQPREQPVFAWVHFNDPHAPYEPPERFRREGEHPYDGEIAYADAQLGRLLHGFETAGRADDLLVVVTADHGEGFGQHGEETHGLFLYDSTLLVPLVVVPPGGLSPELSTELSPEADGRPREERVAAPVTLADVAPTVLHAAGLPPDALPDARGLSLLDVTDDAPDRALYVETLMPWHHHRWHPLRGVVWQGHKLVDSPKPELYDVASDPDEEHDLAAREPGRLALLRERLAALVADERPLDHARGGALSAEDRQRLAALGYTGTAAGGDPFDPSLPVPADRIGDLALARDVKERVHEAMALRGELGDPAVTLRAIGALPEGESAPGRSLQLLRSARDDLVALRARNPGDPLFAFELGFVRFHLGDRAGAIEPFEEHALAVPDDPVTRWYLAECYAGTGRPDWALAEMLKAATLQPRSFRVATWIAERHALRGEWGHATWWYEHRHRAGPPSSEAERRALQDLIEKARAAMSAAGQRPEPTPGYPATDMLPEGVKAGGG